MGTDILVVDDDAHFGRILRLVLAGRGYHITAVADADAADAAVRAVRPALVLLDLWLGERDAGWRLLERWWADPVTASLRVLVWSADHHALRDHAAELHSRGCAVLERPCTLARLLDQIARLAPALADHHDELCGQEAAPDVANDHGGFRGHRGAAGLGETH